MHPMSVHRRQSPNYGASRPIDAPGNPADVRRLFGRQRNSAILESVANSDVCGRWSYYGFSAIETIRIDESRNSGLDELAQAVRRRIQARGRQEVSNAAPPFLGGWIGYLSYEAGKWIEPSAGWRHPATPFGLAEWRFYDTILAHDSVLDAWHVAGIENDVSSPQGCLADRLSQLESFVRENVTSAEASESPSESRAIGRWNMTDDEYLQHVGRILDYIRAGDVYQANMTRRFSAELHDTPLRLYESLCRFNPAAFAGLLRFDDAGPVRTIQSSSPELFLTLENGVVTTRPIKGTRPRSGIAEHDRTAVAELEASDKERAELNMIIDLERNDLGRVCEYGSICVESAGEIEAHPTVFHRTATIRGRLREGCDAMDLIRATFPGGSITGAPKVRAMQIIDELESEARGPYCGAIGYIGADGNMVLNLPIRTLTTVGDRVTLAVGSGIVADSNPQAELEELNAKAAGMMRAIAQCQQAASTEASTRWSTKPLDTNVPT